MTIPIPKHWADRLNQIDEEQQQLRQQPAVVQFIRAGQEIRSMQCCIALDAGHNPADFLGIHAERTADGVVLVLDEAPKPVSPEPSKE